MLHGHTQLALGMEPCAKQVYPGWSTLRQVVPEQAGSSSLSTSVVRTISDGGLAHLWYLSDIEINIIRGRQTEHVVDVPLLPGS